MAEKKSFILYANAIEQWKMLSNEQAGILIKSLFFYYETGERLETNDGMLAMAFSFISAQMDRDREKYEEVCKKRSEAGKKGGAPKSNSNAAKQPKQTNACFDKQNQAKQAKQADNDNENVNENVNENENVNDTDNESDNDINTAAPPSSSPQTEYKKLCDDFGTDNADAYIKKVKNWYAEKGKPVSNLYDTARKWLEQDGVKKSDFEYDFENDKYAFVFNNF